MGRAVTAGMARGLSLEELQKTVTLDKYKTWTGYEQRRTQLIASVLSKKIAAGSTHVVIDIPVGPTAKVRSEGRDDAGRMIVKSPYIKERSRPPEYSFAGLIPGSEAVAAKTGKNEIANVPIPLPRPTF